MSAYEIRQERTPRGNGLRYFIYLDGVRQYVVCGKATSQGGFFRRAVAEAWLSQRERAEARRLVVLGQESGFFPTPIPDPPF